MAHDFDPRHDVAPSNGRIKFSLNALWAVLLAAGGIVTAYYRGQIETLKDQNVMMTRIVSVEKDVQGTQGRQEEIIRRLDRVDDRFNQMITWVQGTPRERAASPTFPRGKMFDK